MSYEMNYLPDLMVDQGASDLHIQVGQPPTIRLSGSMTPIDGPALTPLDTEKLMQSITPDAHISNVKLNGGADFGFAFGDKARFRVSVMKAKTNYGMVLRQIPFKMFGLRDIGLPDKIRELLYRPRGLILVTGPTGSGKSTTLASMVNYINEARDGHIITIEDPIEYYHNHKRRVVTQREVHVDVPSFSEAIRRALRQDPDVILVGEMRDLPTISSAVTAAETGHLVFGTLHTSGAASTINRIIDAFPTDSQEQIRVQLANNLIAVLSQTLCPRIDTDGMLAAYEFMYVTPGIQNLIRENKSFRIDSDIQTGKRYGMQLLDDNLWMHFQAGRISSEEAIDKSKNPGGMVGRLQTGGEMIEKQDDARMAGATEAAKPAVAVAGTKPGAAPAASAPGQES